MSLSLDVPLLTHPAIRLRPPSILVGDRWVAEHLTAKKLWALDKSTVLLLLSFMRPQPATEACERVADVGNMDLQRVIHAAEALVGNGALVAESTQTGETKTLERVRAYWQAYGWSEAFDHHLTTLDYPFIDYSQGFGPERKRMDAYVSFEPDTNRKKTYPDAEIRKQLPRPVEAAKPHLPSGSAPLNFGVLAPLLSIAFGQTGEVPLDRVNSSPVVLRTSPSGGARHPTEAYVVACDVGGLESGIYHLSVAEPALELLEPSIDRGCLRDVFYGVFERAKFEIGAVIVMTSLFERNMYRYREPRTFRSIHLDAGHLISAIERLAANFKINAFPHYGLDVAGFGKLLNLDPLAEGALVSVGLGTTRSSHV